MTQNLSAPTPAPLLSVEGLTKRFGGLTAVNNMHMQVHKGEIVGIIGPNGSGKTTLFSLISGFLTPNEGDIIFEGQKIQGEKPYTLCERGLSRTFQVVQPFRGISVTENIMTGAIRGGRDLNTARTVTEKVIEFTGLGYLRDKVASGLTISEYKRLEVARALATEPKLLLLDEVMAGLRPTEVDAAIELIRKIRDSGITIIFVEHLMRAVVALSDRLYAIHHGTLITEGLPQDVLSNGDVIDAYFGRNTAA